MMAGKVAGFWAGPPCETWSQARARRTQACRGPPPRPLRTAGAPWGLRDLTPREAKQVEVGNALLRSTIYFLFVALNLEIPGVMEHPAPPFRPDAPSAWALPELAYLATMRGVRSVLLDQCVFGAPSVKPTQLLTVHLPHLGDAIRASRNAGRCLHGPRAHETLEGLELDGEGQSVPAWPLQDCRSVVRRRFQTKVAPNMGA